MHTIEQLITECPSFHAWPDNSPANWSVAPAVLRYLHQCLSPGMQTLETGAGQTTVAFAIAGTQHVCITPKPEEAHRIRSYFTQHGIADTVTFIHESSDVALPAGQGIPQTLDFVLIDGAHRFPFPIIDWHYTEQRIRVGGVVCIDDYPMPSVRILHDFLMGEDEWEPIQIFQRTSFFCRKRETKSSWDWADQNINQLAKQAHTGNWPKYLVRLLNRSKGRFRIRNRWL